MMFLFPLPPSLLYVADDWCYNIFVSGYHGLPSRLIMDKELLLWKTNIEYYYITNT
jgi:hypothetical protein